MLKPVQCRISFGAMSTKVKAYEAKMAVTDGASEIDMVISIGDVLEKLDSSVRGCKVSRRCGRDKLL